MRTVLSFSLLTVSLALLATPLRCAEGQKLAFYGVLAGETTEQELRNNEQWGQARPLTIAPSPEMASLLEYRFGIWRRILVAISADHVVSTIEVTPPAMAQAGDLAKVLNLGELVPYESPGPQLLDRDAPAGKWQLFRCSLATNVALFVEESEPKRYVQRLLFYVPRPAYLGVALRPLPELEAKELGITQGGGLRVLEIAPASPAERAGFRLDDVLLEFNGQPTRDTPAFIEQLHALPIGSMQVAKVFRDGTNVFLGVTLEPRSLVTEYSQRATQLADQGRYQEAAELLTRAIELAPQFASSYGSRAFVHAARGETGEAVADYSRAIELRPAWHYYADRAIQRASLRQWDAALEDAAEAIRLKEHADCYAARGFVHAAMGNADQAMADLNRALQLDPQHVPSYYYRGMLYLERKDQVQAIADFDRTLRLRPRHYPARFQMGLALQQQRQHELAIAAFEQILKFAPQHESAARVYYNIALSYKELARLDDALKSATEAIRREPAFAPPYRLRAFIYQQQGEQEKGAADYARFTELAGPEAANQEQETERPAVQTPADTKPPPPPAPSP